MVWSFGDSAGNSFDEGANFALKKRQMAFEHIKQKYEMHKQAYDEAQRVINDPNTPNSRKLIYYNQAVVPFSKQFMGVTLPTMNKWTSDAQDAAEKVMGNITAVHEGKLSAKEASLNIMGIKADYANEPGIKEALAPMDSDLEYALGRHTKEITVGSQKGTAIDNGDGTYKFATVNGQQASGPTSESITQDQNKHQNFAETMTKWLDASKLIAAAKDPTLGDIAAILAKKFVGFKDMSPADQAAREQQALNDAHAVMYGLGGTLRMKTEDITSVINGTKSAADLRNQVGKNFALDGAKDPAPAMNLPGLTIQPKAPTVSQAPAPADIPQMAAAPDASTPPPTDATGPLADNASNPTDKEEQNV